MRSHHSLGAVLVSLAACATAAPPAPAPPVPTITPAPPPSAASSDPCDGAVCPERTRCEATRAEVYDQGGNPRSAMLPRCVPRVAGAAPVPSRDPCAAVICPAGYHCTAPADAPYCAR